MHYIIKIIGIIITTLFLLSCAERDGSQISTHPQESYVFSCESQTRVEIEVSGSANINDGNTTIPYRGDLAFENDAIYKPALLAFRLNGRDYMNKAEIGEFSSRLTDAIAIKMPPHAICETDGLRIAIWTGYAQKEELLMLDLYENKDFKLHIFNADPDAYIVQRP